MMSSLRELQYTQADGVAAPTDTSPEVAYARTGFGGLFQSIVINSWGNYWNDPTEAQVLINGNQEQMNLVAAQASEDGVSSLSVLQYQELIILHELKHLFGGSHAGNSPAAIKAFDMSIIINCLGLTVN